MHHSLILKKVKALPHLFLLRKHIPYILARVFQLGNQRWRLLSRQYHT